MELKLEIYGGTEVLRVFEDQVWVYPNHPKSKVQPRGAWLAGLKAEVVTMGQLQQRVSAIGLATVGAFALAAPVQSGNQQFVLILSGPGTDIRFMPYGGKDLVRRLNEAASVINELAARATVPV